MVGGLASGWFADRMGRKGAMLFNNIIAVIAAVFMTGAKYVNTYHFMIIGRFVIGIHSGKFVENFCNYTYLLASSFELATFFEN